LSARHPAAAADSLTLEALADLPQVILSVAHDRAIDGRLTRAGSNAGSSGTIAARWTRPWPQSAAPGSSP
jgi:hypothetical protein